MDNEPTPQDRVGYYGRVSTRRQKLEHQREVVDRYFDERKIVVPGEVRLEDKEKRHKSQKREAFQRLLDMCRRGKLDWIVVAAFDRWGVADVDEFWEFRRQLRENHVRLWSVQDRLELTGCEESDYFRIISHAVSCTMAMAHYADRNISKMVSMALDGWHASGSVPFGCDLRCCPLSNKDETLFRVVTLTRPRDEGGAKYRIIYPDGREEITRRMPLRDCKQTGYRLTPSLDQNRIEAVRRIYELYVMGVAFPTMRRWLWDRGLTHYGHPFQDNALLTILQNPAYCGKPAWGKYAIGHYRQVFDKRSEKPKRRGRDDPKQYYKDEEHFVFPREPVFDPTAFFGQNLWEQVQEMMLARKSNHKPRPRRRNRENHPLNGKVICPDCGKPMVTGQATSRSGERNHYFICGTYAKTQHIGCRANSVRWEILDRAGDEWLTRVKDELLGIAQITVDDDKDILASAGEEKTNSRLLGHLFVQMMKEVGQTHLQCPVWLPSASDEEIIKHKVEIRDAFNRLYDEYRRHREAVNSDRDKRLAKIDSRIDQILKRLDDVPHGGVAYTKLMAEISGLESERSSLDRPDEDLLHQLRSAIEVSRSLWQILDTKRTLRRAAIWDGLVKSVTPIMRLEEMKNGKTRTKVDGFRFEPTDSIADSVRALEIHCAPRGTD